MSKVHAAMQKILSIKERKKKAEFKEKSSQIFHGEQEKYTKPSEANEMSWFLL